MQEPYLRRVVIVSEHTQFLTDTHGRLRQIGNQVLRHTVRHFTDKCRRMCTDRVEITQQDGLYRRTALDGVRDDFFVNLFGIAVWAFRLFDGGLLVAGNTSGWPYTVHDEEKMIPFTSYFGINCSRLIRETILL